MDENEKKVSIGINYSTETVWVDSTDKNIDFQLKIFNKLHNKMINTIKDKIKMNVNNIR
jgi:hypothetical protein